MNDSPFDENFTHLDNQLFTALHNDSPFDDFRSSPFVCSPFTLNPSLGSKKEDYGSMDSPTMLTLNPNISSNSTQRQLSSRGVPSLGVDPNVKTNNETQVNNTSPSTPNTDNTQPQTTQQTSGSKQQKENKDKKSKLKKKKTIFKKKKKGPLFPGSKLEDCYTNQNIQTDFLKHLKKKVKNQEVNLRFLLSIKKFEEEGGDVHGRAMNICFEYLGIGGGENSVSVDTSIVSELSQIIRNKQSSREMFVRAKVAVENSLRTVFNDFNG